MKLLKPLTILLTLLSFSSIAFAEMSILESEIDTAIVFGDIKELKKIEQQSPENKKIILQIAKKEDSQGYVDESVLPYLSTLGFISKDEPKTLFEAVKKKKPIFIKKLLKSGAKENDKDKKGQTPLVKAGYYNNIEVIKLLLEAGAKIDAQDNDGNTALINASYKGNDKVVEFLLKKGADVNIETKNKYTALKYAIQEKKPLVVKLLLKNGAKVNAKNKEGETPLLKAGFKNNVEIIKLLLEAGAKIDAQDNEGYTSLMNAVYKGHDKVVGLLLKKGAKVNAKDKKGRTPLIEAGFNNNVEVVKLLLEAGAKIDAQDNEGVTALMNASYVGNDKVVEFLLKKGADVNIEVKNKFKTTASKYAAQENNLIVLYLLEKGNVKKIEKYLIKESLLVNYEAYKVKATFNSLTSNKSTEVKDKIRLIESQHLVCGLKEASSLKECQDKNIDTFPALKRYSSIDDTYNLIKKEQDIRRKNELEFKTLDKKIDDIMKNIITTRIKVDKLFRSIDKIENINIDKLMSYLEPIQKDKKKMKELIDNIKKKYNLKFISYDYQLYYIHDLSILLGKIAFAYS